MNISFSDLTRWFQLCEKCINMAVNFSAKERKIIIPACAVCANDCYFFDQKYGFKKYVREVEQHRVTESPGTTSSSKVQYSLYKIIAPGPFKNKRILAFRGTYTPATILQDLDLFDPDQVLSRFMPGLFGEFDRDDGWNKIRDIIEIAQYAANTLQPDFVTGHSLGGLLAEVVSSHNKIPGVAFNAPGPVGFVTETSFLSQDKWQYEGVKFEVHLRKLDPVSQVIRYNSILLLRKVIIRCVLQLILDELLILYII